MKSLFKTLRKYIKTPWEITGPCSSPEYKTAIPTLKDVRVFSPAIPPTNPIVPTSDPETVYDIQYYTRDQRRNRPPIRMTELKKSDAVKMMKDKKSFGVPDLPPVYLTKTVEEHYNARGGGYVQYK
ncbi:uncharacterized protein LOC141701808 [Apium graveolens]|uniref:uncharacterized protein LOC141701808 n=1 Tax=Apium graveolens TaxID=4045 RepID=UPI003D79C436